MLLDRPQTSPIDPAADAERLLGGFWNQLPDGRASAGALLASVLEYAAQLDLDAEKLRLSQSRLTVPVSEITRWVPFTLLLSQVALFEPIAYGGGRAYGDGAEYGGGQLTGLFAWPWTGGPGSLPTVCDAVRGGSVLLVEGADYEIGGGYIRFWANPFADPRLAASPVPGDSSISLFGYRFEAVSTLPYRQFGYAFGAGGDSAGETSRRLVNAAYDPATLGSSRQSLLLALAAASGTDLSALTETVSAVVPELGHTAVVTPRNCYFLSPVDSGIPAVGDVLPGGQPVSGSFRVFDISRGDVPARVDFPSLALPASCLGFDSAELTFDNAAYPVSVSSRLGAVSWEFPLGGFPGDVDDFWAEVQRRGLAAGKTLAQWLDSRTAGNGPVSAIWLPPTANPMQFLAANVLRYNGLLVRLRPGEFYVPRAAGPAALDLLHRSLPPNVLAFFYVELADSELLSVGTEFGYAEDSGFMDILTEDDSFSASSVFGGEQSLVVARKC